MDNKMKNMYVKEVSRVKRKVKRYGDTTIYKKDDDEYINRSNAFKKEINDITIAYDTYKKAIRNYNKGVTSSNKEIELAEQNLQEVLYTNDSIFNKKNKAFIEDLKIQRNLVMYAKMSSTKDIKNNSEKNLTSQEVLLNKYSNAVDILNKATEKMERSQGKKDNFTTYTVNDLYEKLFSGANDTPYYEDIVDTLSDNRAEFRHSIIGELKKNGALSKKEETMLNAYIGI